MLFKRPFRHIIQFNSSHLYTPIVTIDINKTESIGLDPPLRSRTSMFIRKPYDCPSINIGYQTVIYMAEEGRG